MTGIEEKDQLDDRYAHLKGALTQFANDVLPHIQYVRKQKWMTNDILQKTEDGRKAKGNNLLFNRLDTEIRKECYESKEMMLSEQCSSIERLDAAHKTNLIHSEIRKATGRKR